MKIRRDHEEEEHGRSVYEDRFAGEAPRWERIGEFDPRTGRGTVDYRRWLPLDEYLRRH